MTRRRAIIVGDKTTHGGTVIQGSYGMNIMGNAISLEGDMVECPRCNGVFPIIHGTQQMTDNGRGVALEGMKTACGAVLIGTQELLWVDDDSHFYTGVTDDESSFVENEEKPYKVQFQFVDDYDVPYANIKFTAKLPDGEIEGITNEEGFTPIFYSDENDKHVEVHLHIDEIDIETKGV
ncbi:PAAR domain-containing protein [Lonepinella sp. MS14437]|uniref:PAAR domain-containing protein n=1 Tax=Lonepinella sp. MS14437 TaxID=3003620 RepID=UPI0036DB8ED8